MSTQITPAPQKKSCLERAIILSIRLLFAFVVGIAIGVGIYYSVRLLYGEYQSITQDYDSRIAALETSQSESGQQVSDRLSSYQERLEALEIQGDTQKDALADLESRLNSHDDFRSYHATVAAGQQETLLNMQDTILAMQGEVNIAQENLETLQNSLTGFQEDITAHESNTEALADAVEENQAAVKSMLETVSNLVLDTEAQMKALEYQMVFLQAMELLTRARLNLVQGNVTLAQSDIEAARALLATLQSELPSYQAAYVSETITLVDDTLTYLPGAPLTAADKLESVWQMLATGLPDEVYSTADQTVTPGPSEESTPSPTLTSTPTPQP
jgi:chromosome segregation ATPase